MKTAQKLAFVALLAATLVGCHALEDEEAQSPREACLSIKRQISYAEHNRNLETQDRQSLSESLSVRYEAYNCDEVLDKQ